VYPNKELRAFVPEGKKMATYHHSGDGFYMFTCWAPDYGSCGCHTVYFQELEANIKDLEALGYHVINMDLLMWDNMALDYVPRRVK
jgi:hypothetical protein